MSLVDVGKGVLPEKQAEAEELGEDMPEGQDDVLAAEWFRQHPLQQPGAAAAAFGPLPVPVAPWKQDSQTAPSSAGTPHPGVVAAPVQPPAATVAAAAEAAGIATAAAAAGGDMAAAAGGTGGSWFAAVPAAGVAAVKVGGRSRFGGHHMATLDVAAATGTGTALLGKRTHASRRGATYAELVRPVHGQLEWDVFRRLLRACTTAKGVSFQR